MQNRLSARVLAAALLAIVCFSGAWPQTRRTGDASAQDAHEVAVKWDLVVRGTGADGMDAYVDRSSIRRAGHVARMASLWDFRSRQLYEGKPYLSARNDAEYDCRSKRFRVMTARAFADHMGRGSVTTSDNEPQRWEVINVGAVFDTQWKTACASS
jgi:hypothetical protein